MKLQEYNVAQIKNIKLLRGKMKHKFGRRITIDEAARYYTDNCAKDFANNNKLNLRR